MNPELAHTLPINTQALTPSPPSRRVPADILIALILLLVIIIGLAIYSSLEGKKINDQNTALSLAARQRMLVERQAKLLYRVGVAHAEKNPIDKAEAIRDLKKSHRLFDQTLASFSEGGTTFGTDEKTEVSILPVEGTELRPVVSNLEKLWRNYSTDIDPILSTRLSRIEDDIVIDAADATREVNEPLLALSTDLSSKLQTQASSRTKTLQFFQQLGALAALLLLGWIAVRVIRNLKSTGDQLQSNLAQVSATNQQLASAQSDLAQNATDLQAAYQSLQDYNSRMEDASHALRTQQEESDSIFSAVSEGLCLIDRDFKIGHQVSDEMFEIFETDHLTGMTLIDLLRPLITDKDLRSLESYLELQFDPKTSENQLDKYNPLEKIEVTLDWDGTGGFASKNLGFSFRRVYGEDDQIVSVLVTVDDVTETVRLENELARAQESRERQTELVFEIVESDPKELSIFLKKAESTLDDINEELENAKITEDSEQDGSRGKKLVRSIFNKVHNIKGNASLLGLKSVVKTASSVEDKLDSLRSRPTFKGEELLTSLLGLAQLRDLLTEFEEIRATTMANFQPKQTFGRSPADRSKTGALVSDLRKLADTVCRDHQKEVAINTGGLDLNQMPSRQFQHTKDLLIQLVRNTIVHGIEDAPSRKEKMKWQEGSIQIKSHKDDSSDNTLGKPCYTLAYRDDGRGLDPQAIGKRAVELDIISKEELEEMGNAQLSALIFDHAFSSVDISDDHAGRGAGMGLIRSIVNQELNGKLRMTYETGEYLEFTISIPQLTDEVSQGEDDATDEQPATV